MQGPIRAAIVALALALPAPAALAQGTQVTLGGFKQDSSLPVQVTSDSLSVNQNAGTAVFTGNVVVIQGDMRMTAPWVKADYTQGKGTQKGRITRIHAKGGVTLVTSPTEAAEGQDAVYTIGSGQVVMTGAVVLTQGDNAMSGQKLVIHLNDGTGTMEGRVRTTFQPSGTKTDSTKPGGGTK